MSHLRVLGHFEVLKNGSTGNDTVFQVVHAEALQVSHRKVAEQFLARCLVGKHPVVEFKRKVPRAEIALKVHLPALFKEHFLGLEVAQQLFHMVVGTLSGEEFTG